MTTFWKKRVVVTDLDGTLLDERYCWDPARPAIERLRELGFPLVLNSSKTLSELQAIAAALPTDAPLIAENGGVIAVPEESLLADVCETEESVSDYRIKIPGLSRKTILGVAHDLRRTYGYAFEGFADWSVDEIIQHTGLSREQAILSSQRNATEPISWNDSEERFAEFSGQLSENGIRILRGGRFFHLMGPCDKAGGLRLVMEFYRRVFPDTDWSSIALGDGPNDLEMLSAADVAVVIPNLHGYSLPEPSASSVFRASLPGPAGWGEAIFHLLTK